MNRSASICSIVSSLLLLSACGSDANGTNDPIVQPNNTGGATVGAGGASTSSSGTASGGRTVIEGGAASGGAATAAGGTVALGGTNAAGGHNVTGGVAAAGGSAIGGSAAGGRTAGGSSTGGRASGGSANGGNATGGATGGNATGGRATGGNATGGAATGGNSTGGTSSGGGGIFNPSYILGADISWTLEQESIGRKYVDGGVAKSVERIFADHGFNYIRLRTFVCPSCPGGYTSALYSGARNTEAFCDTAHTIKMAKRVKACRMGLFLDFHMSDTWASIGHQEVPSAWAGMSAAQMQTAAYNYVKGVMTEMVAAGVKPDMVQVGNETNSRMSGVAMSSWANFSGLVNAGIRAVREIDPNIIIWAQHGRPRPDGNFRPWVDDYLGNTPKIDVDGICGSTYGTTNNGDDWRQEFGYVISKYKLPVMSCEYSDPRRDLINSVMRGFPNGMGRGTFLWEPTAFGDRVLFDFANNTYTANANMKAYGPLARSYGLPVPSTPAATLDATTCK